MNTSTDLELPGRQRKLTSTLELTKPSAPWYAEQGTSGQLGHLSLPLRT